LTIIPAKNKTAANKTYKQYGLRAFSLGLRIFMKSAKSLGFCFLAGQKKTKPKDFAMCVVESKR
tara:strand:+ start:899 stop:1090 length:192 start_codon:yes stop_codon:yes gene_type:complete